MAGAVGALRQEGGDAVFDGPFHAVDGDTLTIDGTRMRLRGLDAPERKQECGGRGETWACGLKARQALQTLAGRGARCAAHGRDKYRRRLVRCTGKGGDLGAAMVRGGHAVAYGDYEREEAEARAARRGLWSGPFQRPQDWRKAHKNRLPADERPEQRGTLSSLWDWSRSGGGDNISDDD